MDLMETELELYPEEYLLEEDEMGESNAQFRLIKYLVEVLEWYYRLKDWLIAGNLELHHPAIQNTQAKITPDVIVFKGILITEEERQSLSSWDISSEALAPPVVFEISSRATWRNDIWAGSQRKPAIYGRIGVKEYFTYDPHQPRIWKGLEARRLLGWRYENSEPVELEADEQGRLWSEELESWLVADGSFLRLYDRDGNLRLREGEAREQARRLIEQRAQSQQEAFEQRILELEREMQQLREQKP